MLRNSREDMDRQPVRVRIVDRDELDARVHQRRNEREIARQAIQLGDNQLGLVLAAGGERSGELRPIGALAALDLDELLHKLPGAAVEVARDGFALRVEPKTGLALPVGRNAVVGDELARMRCHWMPLGYDCKNVNRRLDY